MIINEIFYSLQGEGLLAGLPSIFIRLAGCPLRCRWCDTKYALDYNLSEDLSIGKIIDKIKNYNCDFVVITGGEPMANPDLSPRLELKELADALKKADKHITIETAGIVFLTNLACDLMSISPKLSNSFSKAGKPNSDYKYKGPDISVLKKLIKHCDYQLKFVVDSPDDIDEIIDTIKKIGVVKYEKVLLMPQAATRDELLSKAQMVADLCKHTGFTFSQRLQVFLWNNEKGT